MILYSILQKGITILLMNLDNSTTVETEVALRKNLWHKNMSDDSKEMKLNFLSGTERAREEYHLTPHDGNIHSQIMALNGNILTVNSNGEIPSLQPIYVNPSNPIVVAPFSIVFAHIPDAVVTACK
ncbi:putative glycosidase [Lupinus albus]|uniref:Putative glycosidase n=1 Tax=Lupinus albus TaxID=3870 RepID=A0A6A4NJF5_LUPAL|nr:putative glycosidase [Lupinus albus]